MSKLAKRTPVMTQSNMLADKLLMIAEAEECRDSLKLFVQHAWKSVDPSPFVDGWVIDALCDHLTALTTGQIRFLLINIPPRHSKSSICSVIWPVWDWLHKPEDKFLCASYSLSLALRDNDRKRNLINSNWFQQRYGQSFRLTTESQSLRFLREKEFALKQSSKSFFLNDKMGYCFACSVGASTTGHGGSVLSIDDPHSATEAHSVLEREAAITWFREVWSNRMNNANKDRMLAIGQRIHELDISGITLKERPDWTHLNLPAEYEPARRCFTSIGWSDPRKEAGELLWPERFSKETLERYKRDLGSMGYAAQYQQSPVPSEGGQFKEKWFRYFSVEGDFYSLETPQGIRHVAVKDCWRFTVVDLAISTKQSADWTVIQTFDVTPQNELLLIDQIRGHFDNPEQQRLIRTTYFRLRPRFVQVESVGYQLALIQQLRDEPVEVNGQRFSIPIREYKPVRDKVSRASSTAILMENGKFYFLKTLPELPIIKTEYLTFPKGANDDMVDCGSQASEVIFVPMGPVMWGIDDEDAPAIRSDNTPPLQGQPMRVASIFEQDDFDEGETYEFELQSWQREDGRW